MLFYNNWPMWKTVIGIRPTPVQLAELEAEQLAFEVLQRELQLIDDHHRLDARKAKIEFIYGWLKRDRANKFSETP